MLDISADPLQTGMVSRAPKVYVFGAGRNEGDASMCDLLGGKGANLAEMSRIGLSVPPGFTITTAVCAEYNRLGNRDLPLGVWEDALVGLREVEAMAGLKLGDAASPLLLSVRSGAAISMPGMLDTVLNLGLNDLVVEGLAAKCGAAFAYDSYRRFMDMYGCVVLGMSHESFERELDAVKREAGVEKDNELDAERLRALCARFKGVYREAGLSFPEDPLEQMRLAICAVFDSWNSARAIKYREVQKIKGLRGTAVNVQAMAYGNMGDTSATGVLFTRDASTGENRLYGEYLINAQGEDVVAGIRTPEPIETLRERIPEAYDELLRNTRILEEHYRDMQDIEFTVQEGKLYMLQCRSGKRTGVAAVKIATDMVREGLVTKREAVNMVGADHLDQLLHPQFTEEAKGSGEVVATGLPASPGAAVGVVAFSTEEAEDLQSRGQPAILVRVETSPEDVGGMAAAQGILTERGGMTSHAAVVARGWGKTCISGATGIKVNEQDGVLECGAGRVYRRGDWVSLDGSEGKVYDGKLAVQAAKMTPEMEEFMGWVDEMRKLRVLANADTPEDAEKARENGAEGIGLVRTEHMFFKTEERLRSVRRMIMAADEAERRKALDEILVFQREDFEGIFRAMRGLPVTIRLLDPPLHEFLPEGKELEDLVGAISLETSVPRQEVLQRVEKLQEVNPMLGFRGCRLAIAHPEIARTQARAVLEAACNAQREGCEVFPDIMVPLVGSRAELANQERVIRQECESVMREKGIRVDYKVGTMIEVPRAALMAGQIAEHAEFFSFGTNDLTQMTMGFSRDDSAAFLNTYLAEGIIAQDPFQTLDAGVKELMEMAVKRGRKQRPDLKVGLCGEHGGDPASVKFCDSLGLNYVSCSPFRVPIARLAAAQAAVARMPLQRVGSSLLQPPPFCC